MHRTAAVHIFTTVLCTTQTMLMPSPAVQKAAFLTQSLNESRTNFRRRHCLLFCDKHSGSQIGLQTFRRNILLPPSNQSTRRLWHNICCRKKLQFRHFGTVSRPPVAKMVWNLLSDFGDEVKVKVKQACTGPVGSRRFRPPHFKTIGTWMW